MRVHYDPKLKERSRDLRRAGILSEVLLWNQLKGKKIRGYLFTRQKPIQSFIVDFYCHKLRLAIEIDGSSHNDRLSKDKDRQLQLESLGLSVLRYLDEDVKANLTGVVASITDWIDEFKGKKRQPPNPLF